MISVRDRPTKDYHNLVESFWSLQMEYTPYDSNGLIPFPCKKFDNFKNFFVIDVRVHSFFIGMNPNYRKCNWGREYVPRETSPSHKRIWNSNDIDIENYVSKMVEDVFKNNFG